MGFIDYISKLGKAPAGASDVPHTPGDVSRTDADAIGSLDFSSCVYCKAKLGRKPQKKTKCKACGKYIYVRKRPFDNMAVLLKEEEVGVLEDQWFKVNDPENYSEKQIVRESLRQKLGRDPERKDLEWGWLNRQLVLYSEKGHWGLYRNARLQMADILAKDKNNEEAALTYLEVYYLDLNGCNNFNGFDLSDEMKLPWLYEKALELAGAAGITNSQLEEMFYVNEELLMERHKLPISPKEAWQKFISDGGDRGR